ncbi:MAG: ABC transporter ATP-binding protein [Syntrophales bacterium]|nr:ABC transporter ATP-binding protein [Syntrophales bacterium]
MLKISNLSVAYGVIPVLHDINLEVKQGELVALLGSNGAGKTTLLNTISGLIRAKEGSIFFLGEEITRQMPDRIVNLGISQIPEGRKIFPYLTVKENLLMGASISRAWPQREEMLNHVYELFPILKERANQRASLMSGGEQQMLVIARGLMAKPKLLMIDEPSLGLSPLIMSKIYDVIKTFPEQGVTVLLSEQNAHMALEIADRGYVLQDGHIVLTGDREFLLKSELVKQAYMGM